MSWSMLPADYLADARKRAYRFTGQWTGTSGALAADVVRLLKERESLMERIEQIDAAGGGESISIPPVGEAACDLDSEWAGVKQRFDDMHNRIRECGRRFRVIGLAGRAGSGKSTVAGMIPGAVVLQLADPLYAALSSMLGVPESLLRSPAHKERELPGLGKSPRQMLQTLGTEWGRELVGPSIWIGALERRISVLREQGVGIVAVADVRFENEANAIRQMTGGEIWRVHRLGQATASAHSSEAGVNLLPGEKEIQNYGNLDALRARVHDALGIGS